MDSYLVCIWSKSIWQKHFWCNTTETRLIFPMASLHVYSAGFTTRLGAWFLSLEIEERFSLQGCLTFKSNSNQSNLIKWFFSYTHFFKKRYTDTLISICNVRMLFSRHNINPSLLCTYVCVSKTSGLPRRRRESKKGQCQTCTSVLNGEWPMATEVVDVVRNLLSQQQDLWNFFLHHLA